MRPHELAHELARHRAFLIAVDVRLKLVEMLREVAAHLHQAAADIGQVAEVQRSRVAVGELGASYRENLAADDARLDLAACIDTDNAAAMKNRVVVVAAGASVHRVGALHWPNRRVAERSRVEPVPRLAVLRVGSHQQTDVAQHGIVAGPNGADPFLDEVELGRCDERRRAQV